MSDQRELKIHCNVDAALELLETHEDCERCEELHPIGMHTVALP